MQKQMRWAIVAVLVGLSLVGVAFREEISFYWNLFRASRLGQQFYAEYEGLTKDVVFQPQMAPRLDIYKPLTGSSHPVLVFVHGGGWKDYDKELFASVAMRLLPEGIVVVIPDYTLYPDAGYEQMADEVAASLVWTLENIDHHGGDPARIVVAGHSAGGHLAGLALMDPRFMEKYDHSGSEFCGFVGMSGVYDVQAEADYWQSRGTTPEVMLEVMGGPENLAQASPIRYARADLLPTLLIHGTADTTVPVSIATDFHSALQAAGTASDRILYEGAGHTDYLFAALSDQASPVIEDLVGFLRRCGVTTP